MKYQILVLAVVFGTICATSFEPILAQINEINPTHPYNKELSSFLELSMMQGSKVEEVLEAIKELLDQMQADQKKETIEYADKEAQLKVEIEVLEYQLGKLNAQQKATNTFISDVSDEIVALTKTSNSLQKQLDMLNGKEEEIRGARNVDHEAFKVRSNNYDSVINALKDILERLVDAVSSEQGKQGSFSEIARNTIVRKIREELGANHPIAMMVSLTTKFDIPTVERIIQRLEAIRSSTIKMQSQDMEDEAASVHSFEVIVQELVDVREKLVVDLQKVRSLLKRRNDEKVVAERTKEQLNIDVPLTEDLLTKTRNQKETLDTMYNNRRLKRQEEVKIIQMAYNIVASQPMPN